MNERVQLLMKELHQHGIDPANPPATGVIRERLGPAAPKLALVVLELWRDLFSSSVSPALPVRLVEIGCGADSGQQQFDCFCLGLRRLLGREGHFAGSGALSFLTHTARLHLQQNRFDLVWRGMYAFFFGRSMTKGESVEFDSSEFQRQLDVLGSTCGYRFSEQADLLTCWLASFHSDEWKPTLQLLSAFLEFHRETRDKIGIRDCLAFWLRAVSACPHPTNPSEVLSIGSWVLESLETERAQLGLGQLASFDDSQAWGYFAWAIAALSNCLTTQNGCREQVVAVHARHLEGFSARMALNYMARISDSFPVLNSVTTSPLMSTQENITPGISWREMQSCQKAFDEVFAPDGTPAPRRFNRPVLRNPIPKDVYDRLSRSFSQDQWRHLVPQGAAFLGGYELPHSGRPIVVLAFNQSGRIYWDAAAGKAPESRVTSYAGNMGHLSPLSASALAEQNSCEDAWSKWSQRRTMSGKNESAEQALGRLAASLCGSLVRFHEEAVNPEYGPLIDFVVGSVERQAGGHGVLDNADLVFCPRGPLNMAAPALVGGRRRIGRIFRSITVSPSLAVFGYLHERSNLNSVPFSPRLGTMSWDPDNSSNPNSPARRFVRRAIEKLSAATDLWLAAERPMATLETARQMTALSDWTLLFAHGQSAPNPTGARLADGLFPTDLESCSSRDNRAGVLLLLSCLAGRLVQVPPYVDAFGPITEEAILTFCLSDRLPRPPTLVGAFTRTVEAYTAVDLGIELVRRRLQLHDGPVWAGFARVQNELLAELMNVPVDSFSGSSSRTFAAMLSDPLSKQNMIEHVSLAARNPMKFLGIYSVLNFRLTGCEPKLQN